MLNNPLTLPIARIIRNHPQGLSEFELMQQLVFDGLELDQLEGSQADLLLFRKHFLVMNALYRLQPIFWEEGLVLKISALKIELIPVAGEPSDQLLPDAAGEQQLRSYYLDWNEFERSSDETVQRLLEGFWQRGSVCVWLIGVRPRFITRIGGETPSVSVSCATLMSCSALCNNRRSAASQSGVVNHHCFCRLRPLPCILAG
jgi:hypothetical protein